MKKLIFIPLLTLCFSMPALAQFNFGVSPGLGFNSAHFGYRFSDNLVPFIGIQYFGVSGKEVSTYQQMGPGGSFSQTEEYEFDLSLVVPNIGLKYFMINREDIRGYGIINISKPFISSSSRGFNPVEDISLWGGEFGFGVEYFFSEQFSLGGEFGLRYLYVGYDRESSSSYNPNPNPNPGGGSTVITQTSTDEMHINFTPTYSRISLNYYFVGE